MSFFLIGLIMKKIENLFFKIKALIELRRIEAAEDIATKLGMSPNVTYINEGSNMLINGGMR